MITYEDVAISCGVGHCVPSCPTMRPLVLLVCLLSGCVVQDLYTLKKGREARFGTGENFARLLHEIAYLDADAKAPEDFHSGKLPVDLVPNESSRTRASSPGADRTGPTIKMTFVGIEGERMCFEATYAEKIGDVNSTARGADDPRALVDRNFRAYHFGAELVPPYESPEVQQRKHIFPKANFSQLDEIEFVEQETVERKQVEYAINTYRVCGKALAMPEPKPKMLTVAVALRNKSDDEASYLLLWVLD
jgi:hypothetical protein